MTNTGAYIAIALLMALCYCLACLCIWYDWKLTTTKERLKEIAEMLEFWSKEVEE